MLSSDQSQRQRERFVYYASHALKLLIPPAFMRSRLQRILSSLESFELEQAHERVAYYAALTEGSTLGGDAVRIGAFKDRQRWTYYFDLRDTLIHFHPDLRFCYFAGDARSVPKQATFIKSRPVEGDNRNSVLLKLNEIRHFHFVEDSTPFQTKHRRVVWRGNARKEHRRKVLERFISHPLCDFGHVGRAEMDPGLCKPWMSIRDQLANRYVLNIEGNDVATSLKWSMASQSLCLMIRPRYETWFMEGKLVPGVHYVELADDYSDLEAQVANYEAHPQQAEEIIRNANLFVAQFRNAKLERAIQLLVAIQYFGRTGQSALLDESVRRFAVVPQAVVGTLPSS